MTERMRKGKLAFLTPKMSLGGDASPGIQKKVGAQVRAFRKLGFETELFGFAPYRYPASLAGRLNFPAELRRAHAWYTNRFAETLSSLRSFAPDAIYIRYNFSENRFLSFLRRLRETFGPGLPIYLEIPTWPYDLELRSSGNPGLVGLYYIDRWYRRRLNRYISRIVTFGDDSEIFAIPTIRIGNGVDTDAIRPVPAVPGKDGAERIRFIGVSNLVFWAGYDRMIRGLEAYVSSGAKPEVQFDIAGDGPEMGLLQDLAKKAGVEANVTFHGPCYGERLDELFSGGGLAIGNLAGHRRGLVRNQDLKNREYCARGMPLVSSTIDPGFPDDTPWILNVAADDTPVDIGSLVRFMSDLDRNHPGFPERIRAFAVRHFDWRVMLEPVAESLKAVKGER